MGEQTTALVETPTASLVRVQRLNPNGVLHITLGIGEKSY